MITQLTCAAIGAFSIAACANSNFDRAVQGPAVDLDTMQATEYQTNAASVLGTLADIAGEDLDSNPEYTSIAKAGFLVIDAACGDYLEALFWLNRGKAHSVAQLGIVNTAATGALGLFGVGADAIAAVGGAFGLATSTAENIGESLLYELEPSSVRDLVRKSQGAFLLSIRDKTIDDRVSALWHIAAYAELCKPPSIENEVRRAVGESNTPTAVSLPDAPPMVGLQQSQIEYLGITDSVDRMVRDELQDRLNADTVGFIAAADQLATAESVTTRSTGRRARVYELLTDASQADFRRKLLDKLETAP